MKFIHTADVHLDSPLHGLSAYQDAPAEQLRNATRQAFSELITRAIDEKVDFLVISGDLYDGTWRDHNTGIFFCKEMGRLNRAQIPVFVLFGNHDAESEMTKKLALPDNVKCFSARKSETFRLEHIKTALHGQSFKEKETTQNLVSHYPLPVPDFYNIGVLHTALEGYAAHASYAPCSVEELHSKGYQYWALGHVHEYQCWYGRSTIIFPGNLQGRNIRETGRRGAVLVTVDEDGKSTVERFFVDVLRWMVVTINASNCTSLLDVAREIRTSLESLVATDNEVPLAIRVNVVGRSKAHGELFGLESQLRSEVLGQIAGIGNERLWLEKVRLDTEPFTDSSLIGSRMDALADMQEIFNEAEFDSAFLQELQDELTPFVSKAQLEVLTLVPELQNIRTGNLSELVKRVRPGLLAHLAQSE